jgi:hypothetical protein
VIASVCSFSIAVVNNFVWNRLGRIPNRRTFHSCPIDQIRFILVIGLIIALRYSPRLKIPISWNWKNRSHLIFFCQPNDRSQRSVANCHLYVLFWNYFAKTN